MLELKTDLQAEHSVGTAGEKGAAPPAGKAAAPGLKESVLEPNDGEAGKKAPETPPAGKAAVPPATESRAVKDKVSFRVWLSVNVATTVVFLLMIVGFVTLALCIATVNDMSAEIWRARADALSARMAAFAGTEGAAGFDGAAALEFLTLKSEYVDSGVNVSVLSPDGVKIKGHIGTAEGVPMRVFTSPIPFGGVESAVSDDSESPPASEPPMAADTAESVWRAVVEVPESEISAPVHVVSASLLRVSTVAVIFATMAAYLIGTRMSYRIRGIIDNVLLMKRAENGAEEI